MVKCPCFISLGKVQGTHHTYFYVLNIRNQDCIESDSRLLIRFDLRKRHDKKKKMQLRYSLVVSNFFVVPMNLLILIFVGLFQGFGIHCLY